MYSFPIFFNDLEVDRMYPEDIRSVDNSDSYINIWLNCKKTRGYRIYNECILSVYTIDRSTQYHVSMDYIGHMTKSDYDMLLEVLNERNHIDIGSDIDTIMKRILYYSEYDIRILVDDVVKVSELAHILTIRRYTIHDQNHNIVHPDQITETDMVMLRVDDLSMTAMLIRGDQTVYCWHNTGGIPQKYVKLSDVFVPVMGDDINLYFYNRLSKCNNFA